MEHKTVTAVGIDVSKGKSTVAVRRPGGEVMLTPFQVEHDIVAQDAARDWRGHSRCHGAYGDVLAPIALAMKEAGFFVSIVNAMLIYDLATAHSVK